MFLMCLYGPAAPVIYFHLKYETNYCLSTDSSTAHDDVERNMDTTRVERYTTRLFSRLKPAHHQTENTTKFCKASVLYYQSIVPTPILRRTCWYTQKTKKSGETLLCSRSSSGLFKNKWRKKSKLERQKERKNKCLMMACIQ